jgi:DNA mismatch repair protein MutS
MAREEADKVTPLMQQYARVKAKYPDAILLFRVGDFYETFGQDAVLASRALGIVLTSRNNGGSDVELAGFPFHSLDLYLPRLVKAGYRVAICEQLEKPGPQKKIVKRGVTEVVTPGVAVDDKLLDHRSNNFLAAIAPGREDEVGVAFLDISTGEFLVSEGDYASAEKLLQSFQPSEVIFSKDKKQWFFKAFGDKFYTFPLEEWVFTKDFALNLLLRHFEVANMKGFGIESLDLAQVAAGAVLHYLATTENKNLKHITRIARVQPDRFVWLDRFTIRNLELIHSPHDSGVPLIQVLDDTLSPMGARLLKKWVVLPLKDQTAIQERLDAVDFFLQAPDLATEIVPVIRRMGDLERLISKVPLGKINPREVVQLKKALLACSDLQQRLLQCPQPQLKKFGDGINPCPQLAERIGMELVDEPPVNLARGGVIRSGYDEVLDDLRHTLSHSRELLAEIQQKEIQRTGISSLKIGYNSVFGYYLEVSNKYKDQAPADWVRKQTLTNGERYITDALKQLETKIITAEERMIELEEALFVQLVQELSDYIEPVQHNARLVARLDCLLSFARIAAKYRYCKPEVTDDFSLDIRDGRHPVIERQLPLEEQFVPNNVFLDRDEQQILMITGPNMSGKSAVLRQTALIALMAQMGSFVPASSARIGLLDRIFTRVGASDNITSGESTFMVEMNETASIMNNISDRSLILLDEIGRGTSTYDGISIAWSIAEYLHENNQARPKTLFATHYHELNELAGRFSRIRNFHIATREAGQKVLFLRKLAPGGSQHSFGIHVARMAGMPRGIVERAAAILEQLERQRVADRPPDAEGPAQVPALETRQISAAPLQLSIFETVDPLAGKLRATIKALDLHAMTPIECMLRLNELKTLLEEHEE